MSLTGIKLVKKMINNMLNKSFLVLTLIYLHMLRFQIFLERMQIN